MGKFLRSVLIGVGIGLLIAPKRGEETRQAVTDRFQRLLASFSGNTQSPASVSSSESETASGLRNLAEQAEKHPHMYTPPSTTGYTPAYPEYVNPNSESNG
ncbi:MAG TPA: YtxH domain-containing protein [Ktedonobacteraceae bacterium]|nr:YtxH domain-containing protein [Ktedonobacteraceae bacterium]